MTADLTPDELAFLTGVLDLARQGRTVDLADLVGRGIPVDLTDAKGNTLLILAAYHDHPQTVAMLAARGADPDRVNDMGQTALGAAVFRRSPESTTTLLDHGADPDRGARSARSIVRFFELDDMRVVLDAPRD